MRPSVPVALTVVANHLIARAASLPDPEFARELGLVSGGLLAAAQEYDECAARRVDEIAQLSELLARGAGLLPSRFGWGDDLLRDARSDLRISALESHLDRLRTCLIDLQAWLEEQTEPDAAALLDEIIAYEEASAKRMQYSRPLPGLED